MPTKIYILEDEPLIAETIKTCLEKEGYIICGMADNVKEAIFDVEQMQPDLVLVDITLDGDLTGIDFVNFLKKKFDIPFIFLTSLSDSKTLEKVKETEPFGYIVKPFNEKTLKTNIELALHKHQIHKQSVSVAYESDSFFIKNKGELIRIVLDDLLYIEAFDNYCYVITATQKLLISYTLKNVEDKLPQPQFLRVHRSFCVNTSKITSLQEGYLFIEKNKIPVGKSYRDQLMQHIRLL
ncbi:MAG TPA: response regulator [Flavobacterium sp.]|jgi:DNA-binding LytR/AlgR family response regulator|uniref:LytR/AlgR family response regulator transcription factor n=1 Tax=Flavobacterium sp. TaxID=239 RepID=UPI002C99C6F5|nr:response regulator [Flavobacterium sp.]HPW97849.1 response regulator [Flavobacterium sp.]HQA73520.1 response regulator [Flavobacterium sp.]